MIGALCPKCGSCFCSCSPDYSAIATSERPDRASSDRGAQFRKKPVVIEAWKVPCFEFNDPAGKWTDTIPPWLLEAEKDGRVTVVDRPHESDWAHIAIPTLEGVMLAGPGDWIIKGIKGELYPCKPDIFAATYDAVGHDPKTAQKPNGNAVAGESPDARDALRYRWLRDKADSKFCVEARLPDKKDEDDIVVHWWAGIRADFLDSAIDAAMGSPDEERKQ